jgi:hypothetical protein
MTMILMPPPPPEITLEMFSYIRDSHTRQLVFNGYLAIDRLELWETLSKIKIGQPYPNDLLNRISVKMEKLPYPPGHSGCSMMNTMGHLTYIAVNGMDKHKKWILQH